MKPRDTIVGEGFGRLDAAHWSVLGDLIGLLMEGLG